MYKLQIRNFFKNKSDMGKLMILIGFLTFIPVIVIPFYFYEKQYFLAFFIPSAASVILGFAVCCLIKNSAGGASGNRSESFERTLKSGSLTVLFAWGWGILAGSIPFLFFGNLNFLKCLFESASGWTTTGFTVINVAETPHIFLFHRSFMQFCGGLGVVLMMAMIIQNKQSVNLYSFEGHNDRLTPSVIKTSRTVFILYFVIFSAGVLLYTVCGMPFFESVIHSMSALSTGGFSSRAGGIGEYNSVLIECVTILIMLLGMTNFAVLLLLARRKFKQAGMVSEVKFLGVLLLFVIPVMVFSFCYGLSVSFGESVRQSVFNAVSILSTTGFTTVNYTGAPVFMLLIIIMLMLVGGGIGSTSGGLKLNRLYLLFRGAGINVQKKLSTEDRTFSHKYYRAQGKIEIDGHIINDTYAYAFIYFLIFIVTAILLCFTENAGGGNAIFAAAALTGTTGISFGIFGPSSSAATLIVGIIGMIIARLEINIIIIGICSAFTGIRAQSARRR